VAVSAGGMLVVGLTGGIACGKSTAADALEAEGAPVVRSDRLAREVVARGQPAFDEVCAAFGPGVVGPDGELDRRRLAERIFADAAARRRLEAITHPRIHERMLAWLRRQAEGGAPAAVCEIPLLFEAGYAEAGSFVDRIWVVAADPGVQLRRLLLRDGLDPPAARARLAAQWPTAAKVRRADLVLRNDGTPGELAAAARAAWRALLAELRGDAGR
jgi:dephospho-CoA kinase